MTRYNYTWPFEDALSEAVTHFEESNGRMVRHKLSAS